MRPNILLINSHDCGRFFACYGVETVRTPHLDKLAQEGVLLEQFTAVSPICSPSRGSMMTGRWPQRNGLLGLTHHGFRLNPGERHAAALFKSSNYETTLFHFQHVAEKSAWPELGFEQFLSPSRDEEFPNYPDMAIPAPELGEQVATWLSQRSDERPFFAQVNFNESHTPFDFGGVGPDRRNGVTVPPWIERDATSEAHFAMLQGAIAALDTGVGRILEGLEAAGLRENTLVVFAGDHGIEAARDKWTVYESGLGIAGLLRYPAGGIKGGRRVPTPLSNIDLLPTLLDIAGLAAPENLDGQTFAPLLSGGPPPEESRPVYAIYHNAGSRSVRVGNWKLIRNFSAEPYGEAAPVTIQGRRQKEPRPPAELYDLTEDPHELCDLAPYHPERVRSMSLLLGHWMQSSNDPACLSSGFQVGTT